MLKLRTACGEILWRLLPREAYGVRGACSRCRPPCACDSGSKLHALHTLRAIGCGFRSLWLTPLVLVLDQNHHQRSSLNDPLLSAVGLRKTYTLGKRELEVLRGVDVTLARGDFLAVRGASGAGKSTLLHLLGGLDSPTAGEVKLGSRSLADLSS